MVKRTVSTFWLIVALLIPWLAGSLPARAQSDAPLAFALSANGPLTTPMAGYLERGIQTAERQGAELLVFQLNTPGGSITIMNQMVEIIRGSSVPVVVFIAPRGAMAASAGTLITLAGHVAAMAPETTIGAASPVNENGQDLTTTMQAKTKNELKATARALAERRGARAMQMAESAIDAAQAVSSTEARQINLVDFIASDVNDLLRQMDGFRVTTSRGEVVLHTKGIIVEDLPPTFLERLLDILSNPNIVLLLMNVGVVAILIEITSPGGWVAGFIGVICLALAVYGLGILPVNWFGAIFILLAFVLFILDIKAPTHGALTVAGIGSLIAGGLVFFNSPGVPGFDRVSIPLVVGSSFATGGLFFVILVFALRAQKIPVLTGVQRMVGLEGVVSNELSPTGIVQVGAERWSAELAGGGQLPHGARVRVLRVKGLTLIVQPLTDQS